MNGGISPELAVALAVLTASGVVVAAVVTARAATARQKRQLAHDAERQAHALAHDAERQERELAHDRQMRDLQELRAVVDDAIAALTEAVIALAKYEQVVRIVRKGGSDDADAVPRIQQAEDEYVVAFQRGRDAGLRITVRTGFEHDMSIKTEALALAFISAYEATKRGVPPSELDAAFTAVENARGDLVRAVRQTIGAVLPSEDPANTSDA